MPFDTVAAYSPMIPRLPLLAPPIWGKLSVPRQDGIRLPVSPPLLWYTSLSEHGGSRLDAETPGPAVERLDDSSSNESWDAWV